MDFDDYQGRALETCTERSYNLHYLIPGLAAEAGEVAGKWAKHVRGDNPDHTAAMVAELGDVLWFVAVTAHNLGYSLTEVAEANVAKLADRKQRGTIHGNGDNR